MIILEILLDIRYGYVVMEKIKLSLKGCEKEMGNKDQGFLVLLRNDGAGTDAVPGTLLFFGGGERPACDRSVYSVRSDLGRRGKTRYSLAECGYEILQRAGIFR